MRKVKTLKVLTGAVDSSSSNSSERVDDTYNFAKMKPY